MIKNQKIQNLTRILLFLSFGIPFVLMFMPFLIPILLAAVVALALEPLLQRFQGLHAIVRKRKYFAILLFSFLFLAVSIPSLVFTVRLLKSLKKFSVEGMQSSQFFISILDLWGKLQVYLIDLAAELRIEHDVIPTKEELFEKFAPILIDNTKVFLGTLPTYALSLFVFFCCLFLMITRAVPIKEFLLKIDILPKEELDHVIDDLQKTSYLVLGSILFIGTVQALIVAFGSLLFGYHEFYLIFTVTFTLSFIPVIGAAPVALALAAISFLNGSTGNGIGLLVVSAIAGSIDNVLKPYLFSREEGGVHPLISLLGIVGSIIAFGLPGLLLGPIIMHITIRLGPLLVRKVLRT